MSKKPRSILEYPVVVRKVLEDMVISIPDLGFWIQLPFLNIRFKDKIAGARVFITDAPQVKKTIEKEATQEMADAKFDLDLKCAMNEAGLPGDLKLVNGFI